MAKVTDLTKYFTRTLYRERVILFLIFLLPILLVTAGSASAPDDDLPLSIDDKVNIVSAEPLLVALYAMTAVVLVASLISFFLGFRLKEKIPRLKQAGYSSITIVMSFILVMVIINFAMTLALVAFSLIWVDPINFGGYIVGIFVSTIVFSTLGLIMAELVDTITLGLYGILTVAIMDTAFFENPVYSRRYDEDWMSLFPSHESIQVMLRSLYDTSVVWYHDIWIIVIYELVLFTLYLLVLRFDIGFTSTV